MNSIPLSQDLHDFAIELRKLAYTMPGGCEDPLLRLSERMTHTAEEDEAAAVRSGRRSGAVSSPGERAAHAAEWCPRDDLFALH